MPFIRNKIFLTSYKYRTCGTSGTISSLVGEKLGFAQVMNSHETSCEIGSKLRWSLRLLVDRMANEDETMRDLTRERKSKRQRVAKSRGADRSRSNERGSQKVL